eukprot:11984743-Ditylum_brightwellii.AAC.1
MVLVTKSNKEGVISVLGSLDYDKQSKSSSYNVVTGDGSFCVTNQASCMIPANILRLFIVVSPSGLSGVYNKYSALESSGCC